VGPRGREGRSTNVSQSRDFRLYGVDLLALIHSQTPYWLAEQCITSALLYIESPILLYYFRYTVLYALLACLPAYLPACPTHTFPVICCM